MDFLLSCCHVIMSHYFYEYEDFARLQLLHVLGYYEA